MRHRRTKLWQTLKPAWFPHPRPETNLNNYQRQTGRLLFKVRDWDSLFSKRLHRGRRTREREKKNRGRALANEEGVSLGLFNSVLIKGMRQSLGLWGRINDVNTPGGKTFHTHCFTLGSLFPCVMRMDSLGLRLLPTNNYHILSSRRKQIEQTNI